MRLTRFIKKVTLVSGAICLLFFLQTSMALAGGYENTETTIPHGGFALTTNYCKRCHAVHLAGIDDTNNELNLGEWRLLRPGSRDTQTACMYCHGPTGITTKKVWFDEQGHGLSSDTANGDVLAPDDTTDTVFSNQWWGCTTCHNPHNAKTVVLTGEGFITSKLLKKFPNPKKPNGTAYYDGTTTLTLTQWCTNCHEANYGLHTDPKTTPIGTRYGHDVSTEGFSTDASGYAQVNPDDGQNKGPRCQQCHTGERAESTQVYNPPMTQGFPHAGGDSYKMLKPKTSSGTTEPITVTTLDNLCATKPCHDVQSLP